MKALFRSKTTANELELHIPIPGDAFNPDFNCESGVVSYFPDENSIIWQIPTFVGEDEKKMKTRMNLPTVASRKFSKPNQIRGKKPVQEQTYEAQFWDSIFHCEWDQCEISEDHWREWIWCCPLGEIHDWIRRLLHPSLSWMKKLLSWRVSLFVDLKEFL